MITLFRLCAAALFLAVPLAACETQATANQADPSDMGDDTPTLEPPVLVQVSVAPHRVKCQSMIPMNCLVIDGEYFYENIIGFTHEAGTTYQLEIERSPRAAPGEIIHDGSYYSYRLIRVISATQ